MKVGEADEFSIERAFFLDLRFEGIMDVLQNACRLFHLISFLFGLDKFLFVSLEVKIIGGAHVWDVRHTQRRLRFQLPNQSVKHHQFRLSQTDRQTPKWYPVWPRARQPYFCRCQGIEGLSQTLLFFGGLTTVERSRYGGERFVHTSFFCWCSSRRCCTAPESPSNEDAANL